MHKGQYFIHYPYGENSDVAGAGYGCPANSIYNWGSGYIVTYTGPYKYRIGRLLPPFLSGRSFPYGEKFPFFWTREYENQPDNEGYLIAKKRQASGEPG